MGENVEPIELTAGFSKPPFVIENNEDYRGIQLDLITEIFALAKRPVHFIHVPLARSFSSIDKWHSDGTITLPIEYEKKSVYVSKPYISYQNVVVTLKEDNLVIDNLDDLSGKSIIAFQKAEELINTDYRRAVAKVADYREMADQMKQIELLFIKRTQAIVVDINILKHFLYNNREDKYNKAYTIHPLFKQNIYAAGFKSQVIRDQFNRGLEKIQENGKYQQVLDKYLL